MSGPVFLLTLSVVALVAGVASLIFAVLTWKNLRYIERVRRGERPWLDREAKKPEK